jgi:hypothetical protein
MSGDSDKRSGAVFVWWWLGGFICAGALAGGVLAAVFVNAGVLGSLGLGLLGAILGFGAGLSVAEVLLLIADGVRWDEKPATSRIRRLAQHMEDVTDWVRSS